MPRGGGGFGGGGMRGGGFSGGGMRGSSFSSGGMRSSSFGGSSFRSSSMGSSSSRPFGRTGATRTVSSGPSGPYQHSYNRPHQNYYGYRHHYGYGYPWYYRPWYRRPWYGWGMWGWGGWGGYYRPWYYSPVYVGGGLILAVLLILIILPLIGVVIAVPFSGVSASGEVNYRSTETLNYNEYWYEYENIAAEKTITYTIQAQDFVNFAIANHPFEDFPVIDVDDQYTGTDRLENEDYGFYGYYLNYDSSIDYAITSDTPIDVLVLDTENVLHWYNYEAYTAIAEFNNASSVDEIAPISYTSDYYVVWYNPSTITAHVNWSVTFHANDVIDMTTAPVHKINDNYFEGTFTVPTTGDWYFFVYFDPRYSFADTIDITFDVTYETGVNSKQQWSTIRPKLITWAIIIGIIILIAVIARRAQKRVAEKAPPTTETPGAAPQPTMQPSTPTVSAMPSSKPYVAPPVSTTGTCTRCGATMADEAQFCYSCGKKREGRQIGTPTITTPAQATNCSFCGAVLDPAALFCETCGTRINR